VRSNTYNLFHLPDYTSTLCQRITIKQITILIKKKKKGFHEIINPNDVLVYMYLVAGLSKNIKI